MIMPKAVISLFDIIIFISINILCAVKGIDV